jgi:O-antigen/teichoic acid export membrane protein
MVKNSINSVFMMRLLNLLLRAGTLASKFALIFFLARVLEPVDVGLFGLFFATVSYAVSFIGAEFYIYSTREIITHKDYERVGMLRDHGVLLSVIYAIMLPLLLSIFYFNLLPWSFVFWFFSLLISEHLGVEFNRLLVALSKPLTASIVLFVRSGAWVLFLIPLLLLEPEMQSLNVVLGFWLAGSVTACVLAMASLNKKLDLSNMRSAINWSWIKLGMKVSFPFFIATISLRAVFVLDKYAFEFISGLDKLAAYILLLGIANAMISFLDSGVFVFHYPNMIAAYKHKNYASFNSELKKMIVQVLMFCLIFSAFAIFSIDLVLDLIGKEIYHNSVYLLPWLLLALSLYALSSIPQYCLYACNCDRPIILSHILALPVFVGSCMFFSTIYKELAIPISMVTVFLFVFIFKLISWMKVRRVVFSCLN